jgi:hypothetical protein
LCNRRRSAGAASAAAAAHATADVRAARNGATQRTLCARGEARKAPCEAKGEQGQAERVVGLWAPEKCPPGRQGLLAVALMN